MVPGDLITAGYGGNADAIYAVEGFRIILTLFQHFPLDSREQARSGDCWIFLAVAGGPLGPHRITTES